MPDLSPISLTCLTLAQTMCQHLTDARDFKVVVNEGDWVTLVEILADDGSAGEIIGREGRRARAIVTLLQSVGRNEHRVICTVSALHRRP